MPLAAGLAIEGALSLASVLLHNKSKNNEALERLSTVAELAANAVSIADGRLLPGAGIKIGKAVLEFAVDHGPKILKQLRDTLTGKQDTRQLESSLTESSKFNYGRH